MVAKKTVNKNKILVIVLILLVIGIFAYVKIFSNSGTQDAAIDVVNNEFSAALRNYDKVMLSYQADIFANPKFIALKSFLTLPLEIGLIGKSNPFLVPTPPEDLLLQALSNIQ